MKYGIYFIYIKQKSTEILVLEFKTYYPVTYNMTQNNKDPQDFITSYLFSKLYFELKIGNDVNVQNEINQTLNTIINHKTDSFVNLLFPVPEFIIYNKSKICESEFIFSIISFKRLYDL